MIKLKNVITKIGSRVIHKGVNITINKKDIYAILGASGSGKTMLLREILMLVKPVSGTIILFNKDIKDASEDDKNSFRDRWGVMFQSASLFTSLSVGENIAAPILERTKMDKDLLRQIVMFKLSLVGLKPEVYNMYPNELSGGMRKKAALARALAKDPELLLLDEPTSGLDPVSAEDFDNTIKNLSKALNLTVVMVTHDLDTLFYAANRACILKDGIVLSEGSVDEVSKTDDDWAKKFFYGERGIKFQKWKQNRII